MTHALGPIVAEPRAAGPQDLDAARRLLSAAGLPLAGVDEHFAAFSVLDAPGGDLLGIAGVERHGAAWLLRSVVVAPEFRGRGHGSVLVGSVLAEARRARVAEVFLLTTDAQAFFAARCFREVPRATAPVALRSSAELQGACPATATLMRLEVAP
jgi:N-acetylglutamate synthase-like GNAT family acetyltransferase